jgi:hypothetical protein
MITAGKDRKGAFRYVCDPSYGPAKQEVSNRRLIVAAPDLLDLVRLSREIVDDSLEERAPRHSLGNLHARLKKVIAYIDGEKP